MSRSDEFILRLQDIKKCLDLQTWNCKRTLTLCANIKTIADYQESSTAKEKIAIEQLITLITYGLQELGSIVWE